MLLSGILLVGIAVMPILLGLGVGAAGIGRRVVWRWGLVGSVLFTVALALNHLVWDFGWRLWTAPSLLLGSGIFLGALLYLVGLGHALGCLLSGTTKGKRRAVVGPVAAYAVASLIILALLNVPGWLSAHSDAVMLSHFRRHEADFERLATMYREDGSPFTICPSTSGYRASLPPDRLAEYDQLLAEIDVRFGITRDRDGLILVRYWSSPATGLFGQYIEKGYALSDSIPDNIADSLNHARHLGHGPAFRQITDSWHLYYYNRDSLVHSCDLMR